MVIFMKCTDTSKRSGKPCKKDAMVGKDKCHIHGGKSLGGAASPTYEGKGYSKFLIKNRRERVEELEKDRDILLKSMANRVPRALYDLTGEEKHKLYQMLRIEVAPCEEGYTVNDAICTCEPIREYTDRP
jgi:hypothetical protein